MNEPVPRIEPRLTTVEGPHGPLRTAEIELGGVPRGAVLVLCEAGRLDADTAERLNNFAAQGYSSLAADPTAGQGALDANLVSSVSFLLGRLGKQGWELDQIGFVGYGEGARAALLAAADLGVGAAVSVAPTGIGAADPTGHPALVDTAAPVSTPWLGLFGDRDPDTRDAVARLAERLIEPSRAYVELVTYPGADAAVHAACFDSWQRTVEWLNLRVVPRPTELATQWARRTAHPADRTDHRAGRPDTETAGPPLVGTRAASDAGRTPDRPASVQKSQEEG